MVKKIPEMKKTKYLSWQPFRKSGAPGKWTKVHILQSKYRSHTLCGLLAPPRYLEVFDYSSSKTANDICSNCERVQKYYKIHWFRGLAE